MNAVMINLWPVVKRQQILGIMILDCQQRSQFAIQRSFVSNAFRYLVILRCAVTLCYKIDFLAVDRTDIHLITSATQFEIHNVLKRIAMPALVLLVTIFFFQHKQTIVTEFMSLGLTMTLLILSCTCCGALLALLLRLSGKERRTLVIEIGMQNAAQAITIACSPLIFNNEVIAIPAIIYALMMNLILLAYMGITKLQH